MLDTFRNAFKIKDIRNRILYTLAMLVVIRIGSQLPLPGVKSDIIANWFASQGADALNFFDAITGGSFEQMSVFALNITPYITSSIIMQLLTIAIPKLEEMQKDGEDGRKKIAEITRYVTIALALIQSIAMAIGFGRSGYLETFNALSVIMIVTSLTAGSAVLMWIGERITEKGVGNGISIVLTINIISRMPDDLMSLYTQFIANASNVGNAIIAVVIIAAVILITVVFVIFLQDGQRRIPVQYSKKMQGRKQVGGQSTHIPLKVNTAGVIPVIFAGSIMQFPIVVASFFGVYPDRAHFWPKVLKVLDQGSWLNVDSFGDFKYSIGLLVYVALLLFFAYFYTSITFNPMEVANNMKKQGGFIPGIRPGKPTTEYLSRVLSYIIFIG
ncbi:MAG: preprotein translocase subunit SecY, partial [Lachnospiraceae bacterium]